jgi:glycosyltransferase involved in cell wall biosynthesis
LKIIALIDNVIGAGGGFDQGLNAIVQMKNLCRNRYIFEAYTTQHANIAHLKSIGINAKFFKFTFLDKFFLKVFQSEILRNVQVRFRLVSPLEKKLLKNRCDLVYFVTPSILAISLQKINYIYTLWDLCHREDLEFPEVREFNQLHSRDHKYKKSLASAVMTITESLHTAKKAKQYYGIDPERLLAMPLTPSPYIEKILSENNNKVLNLYGLDRNYFFYPAQFWSHKNHIRILEALTILRDKHSWQPIVVFSGGDCGNKSYIENWILENSFQNQVKLLGFVQSEHMRGLYENSLAVIMPTYFGPSNLPPLEAWEIGVPLIYSIHLKEQAGEAALLVHPDSASDIAGAMLKCQSKTVRDYLISMGKSRLEELKSERELAEIKLVQFLYEFEVRRKCWRVNS